MHLVFRWGWGHAGPHTVLRALALAAWAVCGCAQAQEPPSTPPPARERLVLGVFAYLGVEQTRQKFAPLVEYLNQTLPNEQVELQVLTQTQMNEALAREALDIVTTNPTHFLVARKTAALSGAFATQVSADSGVPLHQLAGVIFSRADRTDLRELTDLRGQRIGAPSLQHMGGFRAQAYEAFKAGVKLPQQARTVLQLDTHQEVVRAVLDGRVDVGFVRDGIIERMQARGELQPGQIKLIHPLAHPGFPHATSTALYPEWPVFALPHVPERSVRHVASALFALEPDHPAAVASGIYGYTVASDYLMVEDLARALRLPPFDKAPDITFQDIWQKWRLALMVTGLAAIVITFLTVKLALSARRERLASVRSQRLLETLGEGVYGTDLAGHCTFVNSAALQMLGYSEPEVLGQHQHRLFHARHEDGSAYPEAQCPIAQAALDGQSRRTEEWFTRKDGSGFPVEQVVSPLRDQGVLVGTVVAFQDISSRRQTEALQQQARAQTEAARQNAEAANQAKSAFLANMSHEIRTPLNGVLGMAQLLMSDGLSDAERHTYAQVILNSGQTLLSLLNDILDLSKVESGNLELEAAPVAPQELLADLRLLFAEAAAHKPLALASQWHGEPAAQYLADAHRLRQMLGNLLGNAIKFTEAGQVRMEGREISREAELAVLEFSVSDTGVGVPLARQSVLFKPFSQADSSVTREYGGTGLGLSIVRSLAQRMGGEAGLESQPGQGSRFWFTCRVAWLAQEARPAPDSADAVTPLAPAALRPLRGQILVVDDNPVNRVVIEAMLKQLGLTVQMAVNGQDALQQLQADRPLAGQPRLVLMDVQMPVMDGLEATRRIRQWEAATGRPRLPVVALTAGAFAEDRQHCTQAGMDDFLTKPIDIRRLPQVLGRWLPGAASQN